MGEASLSPDNHSTPSSIRSRPGAMFSAEITAARSNGSLKVPPWLFACTPSMVPCPKLARTIWPNDADFCSLMIVLRFKTSVQLCRYAVHLVVDKALELARVKVFVFH